ncbi:GDSL esterase/lipase At3g26430-like [Coffea arabica]|uniref:GDSL esterase/lipase At3g26430-like n=1 Tax=Coffea arabica TaxID=13443 RepID=A0ABM4W3S7_COFAR
MEWVRVGLSRLGLPWRLHRKSAALVGVGFIVVAALTFFSRETRLDLKQSKDCHFPAIFNFGDSNSDTGAVSAAFGRVPFPNGITFFGRPSGRYCDGRLIVDFLAEELEMPYLSAYLDSIGANFRHGANYAASGTTIHLTDAQLYGAGFNPLSLSVQLSQFEQFTARTRELYNQSKTASIINTLPDPEDFSRAIYTVDIGQNDLHFALTTMKDKQVQAFISGIIDQFSWSIENLYRNGARAFWIHNTGPIGCLPFFVIPHPPKPGNTDQNGCIISYNQVAQQFNNELRARVSRLRDQLQDASIIYVDIYSAKYSLISNAKKYGFPLPLQSCCGKIGIVDCGYKEMVNGTEVHGDSCNEPSTYISWDGIHYTEAANKWVASKILDGSFSEPKVSIAEACQRLSPPP